MSYHQIRLTGPQLKLARSCIEREIDKLEKKMGGTGMLVDVNNDKQIEETGIISTELRHLRNLLIHLGG